MSDWQWEYFKRYINDGHFHVRESNCLAFPIESIFIKRNETLDLIIETKCRDGVKSIAASYPPRTIFQNLDTAILENPTGFLVNISGVTVKESKTDLVLKEDNTNELLHESASIHKIFSQIKEKSEGEYQIEWLANVDGKHYMWPDFIDDEIESTYRRIICKNKIPLILEKNKKSIGGRRACVHFSVDGYELYLVTCEDVPFEEEKMPGFILYKGVPSEKIREKIRICASFVFGRPFVYLGHTIFDSNWQVVSFEAISPYNDMEGGAFRLITFPPSPLSKRFLNEIDREIFSHMVNSFYKKYDECNFRHISWLYWHSVCAPLHRAAADFGATLEQIQKPFISVYKIQTTVVESKDWETMKNDLLKVILESSINEDERKILRNRICSNLNRSPPDKVAKKFLKKLKITLSGLENKAWLQRNKSAHGSEPGDDDYTDVLENTKILRILCNRMMLSIAEASAHYFDYNTIDIPVRDLKEPIGGR